MTEGDDTSPFRPVGEVRVCVTAEGERVKKCIGKDSWDVTAEASPQPRKEGK